MALLVMLAGIGGVVAQDVVRELKNVKKPKLGKLYYQRADSGLYVYLKPKWGLVWKANGKDEVVVDPEKDPEPEPDPVGDEAEVGRWEVVPGAILVVKNVDGLKWLLQTDAARSYYVIRGANFLDAEGVTVAANVLRAELANDITGLGGLLPAAAGGLPAKWQSGWWKANGYEQNEEGEWVKKLVPVIVDDRWMIIDEPPSADVIVGKELVGLIDGFEPVYKVVFDDGMARSYRLTVGAWRNVGVNIYSNVRFELKPGLAVANVVANIVDEVTGDGGLVESSVGFKFGGGGAGPVVLPDVPVRTKPLLLSVWGNGGEGFASEQGNHKSEQWMLSQPEFRHLLPFFGRDMPAKVVSVDKYVDNRREGKMNVPVTVDYLMDGAAMAAMRDYVVRAGLNGFNFLWYADDAILREWRRAFVAMGDKRGLKASYNLHNMGGGFENFGGNNEYTKSVRTIVSHLDEDWFMKVDGMPVLSYLMENGDLRGNTDAANKMRITKSRIEQAYGKKIYWVLVCDFYEAGEWYKENGFDAISGYYLYGNYVNKDFKEVVDISKRWNEDHTAAGRVVAPLITLGLDSRARLWYYSGDGGSNYYTEESVKRLLPELIGNTVKFMNANPAVKIGFVNHADELTEQGVTSFTPRRLKSGVIDAGIVEIFERSW